MFNRPGDDHPSHPAAAWRGLAVLSIGFAAVLTACAARYGYHRDELYFLAIGAHPAFGYVDQPPLLPLLAHGLDAASGHSLVVLRVAPAVAGAAVVLVTGLLAREFGAARGAQLLAATSMGVSAILVDVAHIASTSVFDLLVWTLLTWLVVRALRDDGRVWLAAGVVAGIGLEVKTLAVLLLFALLVGILAVGPRGAFASRWLWAATLIALVLWAPNVLWQATHGWPQLALSRSIATGGSGTSQPRWLFVPYQAVLVSPVLTPLWVAGWWRLARDPGLRTWRSLAVAFPLLMLLFVVVGGKPYYLCGMYPALLAAGAAPALAWVGRGAGRARGVGLGAAVGLSAAVSALLMLPILPVAVLHSTPVPTINYDAGETVGWPRFVATVGAAYDALPGGQRATTVVIGANYGEAAAVARYRPDVPVFGAQNSLWDLGPPPAATTTAIVVGYTGPQLHRWFGDVAQVATIDNGVALDNDEQGEAVWRCSSPTLGWAVIWGQARRLG